MYFCSEPPAKFLNKKENNITAYENESVTLCAIVSHERANVRWLKDGQLLNEENIHISSVGNTHKLTINPLQLSDSGEYVCDIKTDEMYFSLLVKGRNLSLNKMWPLLRSIWLQVSKWCHDLKLYFFAQQKWRLNLSDSWRISRLQREPALRYNVRSTSQKEMFSG